RIHAQFSKEPNDRQVRRVRIDERGTEVTGAVDVPDAAVVRPAVMALRRHAAAAFRAERDASQPEVEPALLPAVPVSLPKDCLDLVESLLRDERLMVALKALLAPADPARVEGVEKHSPDGLQRDMASGRREDPHVGELAAELRQGILA